MDNRTRKGDGVEGSAALLMKGDGFFSNRVLSRNSSVGYSSRIYYRNPDGVPFDWEMQPGMPKNLPKADDLPPLSPPPAVLSLGLPKPCIPVEEPKPPRIFRLKFWKQREKKKLDSEPKASSDIEVYSYDGEFMGSSSPRGSTSSTSSSSLSLSNGNHSGRLSSFRGASRGPVAGSYGCGPWKFSWVIVRAAGRQ